MSTIASMAGSPRLQRRPVAVEARAASTRRPAVHASWAINDHVRRIEPATPGHPRRTLLIGTIEPDGWSAETFADPTRWHVLVSNPNRLATVADSSVDGVLVLEKASGEAALELFRHAARIVRRSGHVIASLPASRVDDGDASGSHPPLRIVRSFQKLGLDVVQIDVITRHGRGRAYIRQGMSTLRARGDRPRTNADPTTLLVRAIRIR